MLRPGSNLPLDLIALRAAHQPRDITQPREVEVAGVPLRLSEDQFQRLLDAVFRRANIVMQTFLATNAAPIQLRPQEKRSYLFIQNQSVANNMVLKTGASPSAFGTVPADGIIVPANLGFYEPIQVPQDSLWIIAAAAATPGLLIYAV